MFFNQVTMVEYSVQCPHNQKTTVVFWDCLYPWNGFDGMRPITAYIPFYTPTTTTTARGTRRQCWVKSTTTTLKNRPDVVAACNCTEVKNLYDLKAKISSHLYSVVQIHDFLTFSQLFPWPSVWHCEGGHGGVHQWEGGVVFRFRQKTVIVRIWCRRLDRENNQHSAKEGTKSVKGLPLTWRVGFWRSN